MIEQSIWNHAWDEGVKRAWVRDFDSPEACFAEGAEWAAGWMIALVGMFQAIRDNWTMIEYYSDPSGGPSIYDRMGSRRVIATPEHRYWRNRPCYLLRMLPKQKVTE